MANTIIYNFVLRKFILGIYRTFRTTQTMLLGKNNMEYVN